MKLYETIPNDFQNYVPNKCITIDDKDPVWMNEIKSKMEKKNITSNISKMKGFKVTLCLLNL